MYSWDQFWNTQRAYGSRWNSKNRSFGRPDYLIATPLEQCHFVMTQLDDNKKPFTVDMWGNLIGLNQYGTLNHHYATQFWLEGQGEYFDGYSIVLPCEPNPVFVDSLEYYVTGGIYENCVSWRGKDFTFSSEFIADRMVLGNPLMWFTPDRRGMCWAGLSTTPIIGGASKSKKISSFDLIIPITTFFSGENTPPEFEGDLLTPLPKNADQIIGKWFGKEVVI
jgi:hypothetical protein